MLGGSDNAFDHSPLPAPLPKAQTVTSGMRIMGSAITITTTADTDCGQPFTLQQPYLAQSVTQSMTATGMTATGITLRAQTRGGSVSQL